MIYVNIGYRKFPDHHLTLFLKRDLTVRVIVKHPESETGLSGIDYVLKDEEESYGLTLIQNPLIDYDHAMKNIDELIREHERLAESQSEIDRHSAKVLWKQLFDLWSVAHWYQVDKFADHMTVGMSVAVWIGLNRTNTITLHNVRTI